LNNMWMIINPLRLTVTSARHYDKEF